MDDYLDRQAQQIDRARTFAEIRRIEERVSKMAPARHEARRRAAWPLGFLAARRRRARPPRLPAVTSR
jgi:hypothetical protein